MIPVFRRYDIVTLILSASNSDHFDNDLSQPEFDVWVGSNHCRAKILFKINIERNRAIKLLKAVYEIRLSRITTSTEHTINSFLSLFQSTKLVLGKQD